jgi:DNA (cytosine-5)-methyltransferase 1
MDAVDLFAGSGGFTTGARQAGIDVRWAANHCPVAVRYHSLNHAGTSHSCQDLHQADWTTVPQHDLLLASPCCQGHSHSRGKDRPHHDASRSTAWAVVSCAEYHRAKAFVVENVPEFLDWGLFPAWSSAMAALGYTLSTHVIDAADCGVPQNRVRLFIVGTRGKAFTFSKPKVVQQTAGDIIDFDSGRWTKVRKPHRAIATLRRVKNGRRTFGDRFVMPYYKSGSGLTGRSLDRPLGTVTTLDRWAVVDGDRMRMLTVEEYRKAMGFPQGYKLPTNRRDSIKLLGNAVPPMMAKEVVKQVVNFMKR